jgi:hypothetical protein
VNQENASALSPALAERLEAQIRRWREDLLNLTRRNRALYFRHTKSTSFEIVAPSTDEIIARLEGGGRSRDWRVFVPKPVESGEEGELELRRWQDFLPDRKQDELLTDKVDGLALHRGLQGLERRSETEFVDKGIWTLYLGVGMLRWQDPALDEDSYSPLLLYPVSLNRLGNQPVYSLTRTEDDPVINPALAVKLAMDFELSLPEAEDFESFMPSEVLPKVKAAVAGRAGWEIEGRCVLTTFTFHKEAMYRDLVDNADQLADHPMVRLLALGPDAPEANTYDFDPIPDGCAHLFWPHLSGLCSSVLAPR